MKTKDLETIKDQLESIEEACDTLRDNFSQIRKCIDAMLKKDSLEKRGKDAINRLRSRV